MDTIKANSFELLYNEHFIKVYRLALGLVRNSFDAEEITQESFLRAFRSYNSFREDSSFLLGFIELRLMSQMIILKKRKNARSEFGRCRVYYRRDY